MTESTAKNGVVCLYNGDEDLRDGTGKETGYKIKDFWAWSSSDLVNNTLRGVYAEFIVATALGIDLSKKPRQDWDAYDLDYGVCKIEVKASGRVQAWHREPDISDLPIDITNEELESFRKRIKKSKAQFTIRKTRKFDRIRDRFEEDAKRHADIYVFCLHKPEKEEEVEMLRSDQWEFYIIPTRLLNELDKKCDENSKGQQTIGLPQLKRLMGKVPGFEEFCNKDGAVGYVGYDKLKDAVDCVLKFL